MNKSTKILLIILSSVIVVLLAIIVLMLFKNSSQKESKSSTSSTIESSVESAQEENQEENQLATKDNPNSLENFKASPNSPYYHQIYSATSSDGLNWSKRDELIFDHASVPGAVVNDNKIYLYFVDASEGHSLSVAISEDLGKTFPTKKTVKIEGQDEGNAVDPHPEIVDGKIRLYYLGNFQNITNPESSNLNKFIMYSAQSQDGINFSNQVTAYQDQEITDPDVFATNSDWRMLVSHGKTLYLLVSKDNGLTFSKQADFDWSKGSVCDTYNFNGTYRTFFCGEGGIQSATGADKGLLSKESGVRIEAPDGTIACDPSVIKLGDNNYMMFYKTQKTPSGQQNPSNPNIQNNPNNQPNSQNQPNNQNSSPPAVKK